MVEALIALGGNIGDARSIIARGVARFCDGKDVRLIARSSDYKTPPWGVTQQPPFINGCMIVETSLSPRDLLARAQAVESEFGRDRGREQHWGPRSLDIDILTEQEESERRQDEFRKRSGLFVEALDVDDVIAGLLVTEGFTSVEDIVSVEDEELAGIEGFDESISAELKRRAEAFLQKREGEADEKRRELGVEDAVAEIGGFSAAQLVALGEKGVKTLDDLADLASDELIEIIGADALDEDAANAIIMAARQHWFDGEGGGEEAVADGGGAGRA